MSEFFIERIFDVFLVFSLTNASFFCSYSMLPDGNMDDLSQHEAEPVKKGEKWLINLWTHGTLAFARRWLLS